MSNLSTAVFALLGGVVVDKLGVAKTWVLCDVAIIIGSLLVPIIGNTVSGLVVARVIQAAGIGPVLGSIASCCAQWFKYKGRAYVAAVQGFSVSIGMAIALLYGPAFLKISGSWQGALAWTALPNVIGLILAAIIIASRNKSPVLHWMETAANGRSDFRKALGGLTICVLVLMAFIDCWLQIAFQDMAPGYYAAKMPLGLGLGPMGAGSLLTYAPMALAVGTLVAPIVTERIFGGNATPTISITLVLSAVFVFLVRMLKVDQTALLIIVPCGILFFAGFVNPTIFGYIAKHYPGSIAGKLGGLAMGVGVFGSVIGIGVSAGLLHAFSSYIPSMNAMGIVSVVGALVALGIRKPKGFNVAAEEVARHRTKSFSR
jgi:MFS family permease